MIDAAALHGATGAQPVSGFLGWRAAVFSDPSEVVA